MTSLQFLFRADRTNVGDWWCAPPRYFPFRPASINDILDVHVNFQDISTLIIGGGGLGSEFFRPHFDRIRKADIPTTILWGAGVDSVINRSGESIREGAELFGSYFDFMNEVGTRVFSEQQKFRYVPCVSCLHNVFYKYREVKPKKRIGVYSHKRVPIMRDAAKDDLPTMDNSGYDIEEKIKYLANFEYIVTNSYHGVYWATLLERKVICYPFKSGLYSFKHRPVYVLDGLITDEILQSAKVYPGSLEESRKLNLKFYEELADKFDLV